MNKVKVNRTALLERLRVKLNSIQTSFEDNLAQWETAVKAAKRKVANKVREAVDNPDIWEIHSNGYIAFPVGCQMHVAKPYEPSELKGIRKQIIQLELASDEEIMVTDRDDYFRYL